jgi:dolichol-phosphate mannosyltransferase
MHRRIRHGLRRPHNWVQLVKFGVVGGSGYAVNLTVFTIALKLIGAHHLIAATLAFAVAVMNNFWWNRHWTFGARDHHLGVGAARFFTVSIIAFVIQASILELLIAKTSLAAILAQAISLVAATPVNFIGNKLWTFGHSAPRR